MESAFVWNSKTKVEFLRKMPSRARMAESLAHPPEKYLLIYDKRLAHLEVVQKGLKEFKYLYPVTAGENLKEISDFAYHVKKIVRMVSPFSPHNLGIVALGGGTVGDFAGFLASVVKRGLPLIHIPTTLLAAMDSAHGGKTALNIREYKNQVGTFYPADAVLIVKSLFEGLPPLQLQSAGGELAKMAIIQGGEMYQRFREHYQTNLETIWDFMPAAIEAKYKWVEQDPFEKTGARQVLNLGHSLGHALESYYGIPHGLAVAEGLIFCAQWSVHQGYWRGAEAEELVNLLVEKLQTKLPKDFARSYRSMRRSKLKKLIVEDKKLTDSRHLNFVFLEGIGAPFRKVVTVESLLTETQRQGWTST